MPNGPKTSSFPNETAQEFPWMPQVSSMWNIWKHVSLFRRRRGDCGRRHADETWLLGKRGGIAPMYLIAPPPPLNFYKAIRYFDPVYCSNYVIVVKPLAEDVCILGCSVSCSSFYEANVRVSQEYSHRDTVRLFCSDFLHWKKFLSVSLLSSFCLLSCVTCPAVCLVSSVCPLSSLFGCLLCKVNIY